MCPQTSRWDITPEKTQKREKNIHSEPITTLNTAEINTLTDPTLGVEKQLEFSKYCHNEEKFYVHQILDDACKTAKRCESWKVDFPKENPKTCSDLVVVYKEKYMRPNFYDSTWKKLLLCQKEVPLETTSLFLERQIVCVEISQFETITRIFGVFKKRTTFWYDSCLIRTMNLINTLLVMLIT